MISRLLAVLLAVLVLGVSPAWAGPVEWVEVPATDAGQQWWDSGSVRENREGLRTVLSRFTPAAVEGEAPRNGELFVMQIDCAQKLYRDQQVNGIPRFRAQWQDAGSDQLIVSVIGAVCDAPLAS
tara:strand:- start:457 stop:831 length:375 start_codon:yes stop_codon:yes gene_type:complete